mgnify:CR=1 FL=1
MVSFLIHLVRRIPGLLVLLATVALAISYYLKTPVSYESSALALVHRSRIHVPDSDQEENSNRWVWVRTGMATKESLMTDDLLSQLFTKYPELLKQYLTAGIENNRSLMNKTLRSDIKILYSGGDVYSYEVSFANQNRDLAVSVVDDLIKQLEIIEIQRPLEDSTKAKNKISGIVQGLKREYKKYDPNLVRNQRRLRTLDQKIDYFESALNKIDLRLHLQKIDDDRFEVIRRPENSVVKAWPKLSLLLIGSIIVGLALFLGLEYLLYYVIPNQRLQKNTLQQGV